ncbi:hypothetical protein BC938DRAFT_481627 [Jimgerdemannia flammicorona]|uniref:MalT-like TPR region domain-containing protein n=1 Tax=Jimgerdemannia flammicorona TaxID=994334 RepID=A0A433QFW4_9FUNG|nr:hypothetical protein BC938DRAFT_481627 [Jimgerdemannia flammicorona]
MYSRKSREPRKRPQSQGGLRDCTRQLEPQSDANKTSAELHMQRSLDLHRKNDNVEGIAQVSGNLGQLYMDTGRATEAAGLITDAYETVKKMGNQVSIQYAAMNMGLLADRNGKPEEAVAWYTCE